MRLLKIFRKASIIPVLLVLPAAFIAYILLSPLDPEELTSPGSQPTLPVADQVQQESKSFTPFSAQFLIFTNGTKRIFTDSRYHNRSGNVFIDPQDTTSVQVRKEGVTWQEFFNTLPMSLDSECLVTGTGQRFCNDEGGELLFYINGVEDPNALNRPIQKDDQLLVSFGSGRDRIESELRGFESTL